MNSSLVHNLTRAGIGAAAFGASLLAGALVEAEAFKLREVEVPALRPGSPQLRVLHLSDIHLMPYQRHKQAYLAGLRDLRPDLVINTGDNISSAASIDPLIDALGGLLDVPGGFVFGGNDFTVPRMRNPLRYLVGASKPHAKRTALPTDLLSERLSERGWLDLNNAKGTVSVDGRTIELRGTADAHEGWADYERVAGTADPAAELSLGVTHAPYRWLLDEMTDDGVDMIFAGHTHGGQICLPVYRALVTNCDLPRAQASGLSEWTMGQNTVPLHVDAGIGTSPYTPIRLFCRPGATLLTLVPRDR